MNTKPPPAWLPRFAVALFKNHVSAHRCEVGCEVVVKSSVVVEEGGARYRVADHELQNLLVHLPAEDGRRNAT